MEPVIQPEAEIAAENAEELQRLRFLLHSPQPRVFWVNCDTDLIWLNLIPVLNREAPEARSVTVRLDEESRSLVLAVENGLKAQSDVRIVHVLGISQAAGSGLFLRNLNLEREMLFRNTPVHVIIWGNQGAVNALNVKTRDWWSWMALVFPMHTPKHLLTSRQQHLQDSLHLGKREMRIESFEQKERISYLQQELELFLESVGNAPMASAVADELTDIVLALSSELKGAGYFQEQFLVLEKVLTLVGEILDKPKRAQLLNEVGLSLLNLNRYKESEEVLVRALETIEGVFGKTHSEVASILNNLAQTLFTTDRFAEAEPLMRRALSIDEQNVGESHSSIGIDLNNLASLLEKTGRLVEAETLMRRALAISEQNFGKDHPTVAIRLNNLAGLLRTTNRLLEAKPLIHRALDIAERNWGAGHPSTVIIAENYSLTMKDIGKAATH